MASQRIGSEKPEGVMAPFTGHLPLGSRRRTLQKSRTARLRPELLDRSLGLGRDRQPEAGNDLDGPPGDLDPGHPVGSRVALTMRSRTRSAPTASRNSSARAWPAGALDPSRRAVRAPSWAAAEATWEAWNHSPNCTTSSTMNSITGCWDGAVRAWPWCRQSYAESRAGSRVGGARSTWPSRFRSSDIGEVVVVLDPSHPTGGPI